VEVGSADAGRRYFYDRIVRMKDLGVRNRLNCDFEWLFVYNRFHCDVSCLLFDLECLQGTLSVELRNLSREKAGYRVETTRGQRGHRALAAGNSALIAELLGWI
jgi:hypothetical protein